MARITLGNRDGTLAVRHGRAVLEALAGEWPDLHLTVRTIPHAARQDSAALLDALLNNKIDVAVVQLDALPFALPEGLSLSAVTRRGDARSALVAKGHKSLSDIADGTKVGVFSERDATFLQAAGTRAVATLLEIGRAACRER